MTILYTPKFSFHGATTICMRVTGETIENTYYIISAAQQRRLKKQFCGQRDCACNGGQAVALDSAGTKYGILIECCELI